ncbi:MAG: DivIVA domain-containing protein [Ruminococcaceae bacterium]|nr:DivIVA domain-containing protein [Oscillospiraceae bacterium]
MITPQQIEQISFGKQPFGGYDTQQVDAFLEPLTEDYITLYKENALLKSKMRVLVTKLEEYRQNDASMKEALAEAQRSCDIMVKEAESKCAKMLSEANETLTENTKNTEAIIAAENARVEEARQVAAAKIEEIEDRMRECIQALENIKTANYPANPIAAPVEDAGAPEQEEVDIAAAIADEISNNVEAMVGTTEDVAPKADPLHPVTGTTTKFGNLSDHFGHQYDPTHK